MVHFNDVLGVTAFILITSSGGNLSDYLSSGNWKSVPQQGCILINCTGPILKLYVCVFVLTKVYFFFHQVFLTTHHQISQ